LRAQWLDSFYLELYIYTVMNPPRTPLKGRGAISNPEGRFESLRAQPVDDGWKTDSNEELTPLATTVTAEHAKSIISRNDSPDIPFEQSINPYRGCGHGCCYCMWGDTQVLMGNGRTKSLGDLHIGDEVVGTTRIGMHRRYRKTCVSAHWQTHRHAYRLSLADGTTLIASADHRFLSDRGWKFVTGAQCGPGRRPHLKTGDKLMGVGKSTAALDPTSVLRQDRIARNPTNWDFAFAHDISGWETNSIHYLRIIGGLRQHLRLFHGVDPAITRRCNGAGQAVKSNAGLAIVDIETLGIAMPMYDITTGTGDFIANGVISHNCYARPAHSYVNLSPGLDFETKLFYKENAAELLERELRQPRYVCKAINLGANTDPYQPIERTLKVTRSILEVLQRFRHPVTIVTKGHLIERDIDILAEMARDNLAAVHVSVTTLDSNLKRILEPRAPSAAARLHAIRCLHAAGVPVGTLVAPIIPAINDHEIEHILAAVAQAGARSAAYVMLRLPYEVKDLFREWLGAHYPLRAAHVMSLVNDLRGGRDNDPNFGSRMRGTGPFADLVRRRFEVACRKVNLNTVRRVPLDVRLFRPTPLAGAQLDLGF
jgi:DNA repair photolyase